MHVILDPLLLIDKYGHSVAIRHHITVYAIQLFRFQNTDVGLLLNC